MPRAFKIMIVDDNRAIHESFKKVLLNSELKENSRLKALDAKLFSEKGTNTQEISKPIKKDSYTLESALQGQDAYEKVKTSIKENNPYSLIFVDVRMPPGWDGIKTIRKIWELDSKIEIVICSAYSDYSLLEIQEQLTTNNRLLFLNKPFDPIEVQQMTRSLTTKWELYRKSTSYIENLEKVVEKRTASLTILLKNAVFINQSYDIPSAFNGVLKQVCESTHWFAGHVYLKDEIDDSQAIVSTNIWFGDHNQEFYHFKNDTQKMTIKEGIEIPGLVMKQQAPIWVPDIQLNSSFLRKDSAKKAHIRSAIGIPIILNQEFLGLMEFYSTRVMEMDDSLLEVLNQTATLIARLIERKRVEADLRKSQQKAVAADKSKSEFLANMSHEIRTPLNAILGFTQILQRNKNISEKENQDNLNIIEKSGTHLLSIINTILDISKIDAGKYSITKSTFDVQLLLEDTRNMFLAPCNQKGLELKLQLSDNLPKFINGDATKLKHILINVIGNSVKHTFEGTVSIIAKYIDECLQIEINDTGEGIAEDFLKDIFQPFFQTPNNQDKEGTGLGLAIVKKYTDIMDGDIQVFSEINKGTSFKITLPMDKADNKTETIDESIFPMVAGLKEESQARILILGDDNSQNKLLRDVFTLNLFEVDCSSYDEVGIEVTQQFKPELIFVELNLLLADSSETLNKIKEINPEIFIIGITSKAPDTAIIQSKDAGCHDYICRPYDMDQILFIVKKHLEVEYNIEEADSQKTPEIETDLDYKLIAEHINNDDLIKLWEFFYSGNLVAIESYAEKWIYKDSPLESFGLLIADYSRKFDDSGIRNSIEMIKKMKEKA